MSALPRIFSSFHARAKYFRSSDKGGPGPERTATRVRDLDARNGDTKTRSKALERGLRAGVRPDKRIPGQLREIARITLLGPPAASLILLVVGYARYWRGIPFDFATFLEAFFLFALPYGYFFGAIPLLVAASLYSVLLTANPRLLQGKPLTRTWVAAVCGGLASGVWFSGQLRVAWGIYALAGALVMAALSLGTPQPAPPATDSCDC